MSEFQFDQSPSTPDPRAATSALLQRLREVGIASSAMLFKQAMDSADDTLFGFSEKSDTASERGQYMDAMRNLRVKRPALEQAFREQLTSTFLAFLRQPGRTAATAESSFVSDSLSLVEEGDLEEDLAVDSMSAKANVRHNSALYALNQRMAAVTGAKEITVDNNPLAPPAVCQALRSVIRLVDADITVRLVLLKLFDRHVVVELDQVYDDTNRLLAEGGVLPHIKYVRPARPAGEAPPPKSAAAQAEAGAAQAAGEAAADAGVTNEVLAAFASLLATRRGGERRPTGPAVSNADLLAALSRLQELNAREEVDTEALPPTERVERVKQDLLDQLKKSGIEQPAGRLWSADEDAIDLVSMLFQFVVQDRNLPAEIQAVLSRLQIPYVRVAIKDKHLFAQKVHPARKLLDTLAIAGVGWSKEGDRDGRFLAAMTQTVDRVVSEYSDDFSLFNVLNAEFETVVERQRKHSEAAEQRTADAASGREKLNQARRAVTTLVHSRIGKRQLPGLARELIQGPWTNFLVLTHLRQGPESSEWKSAVNFIDAVIWASLPKPQDKDMDRLRAMLPQMQAFLQRGLNVVGFDESSAQRLIKGFVVLFDSLHQREVSLESSEAIDDAAKSLGTANAQTPAAAAPEAEAPATEPQVAEDDPYLAKVRSLKVGTWLEFTVEGNGTERAKLSWISPFSARLLFVNRKGLKVAERSVYALAAELRAGTVLILEVTPIFERALDAIMERLKHEHAQAGGGKGPAAAPQQKHA